MLVCGGLQSIVSDGGTCLQSRVRKCDIARYYRENLTELELNCRKRLACQYCFWSSNGDTSGYMCLLTVKLTRLACELTSPTEKLVLDRAIEV